MTKPSDPDPTDCLARALAAHRHIDPPAALADIASPAPAVTAQTIEAVQRIDRAIAAGHPLPALDCYVPSRTSPAEEENQYQSAGTMLRRLAVAIGQWRRELPASVQPGLLALLNGGAQMEVDHLSQESFHGIRIDGRIDGVPCVVFAHQATVQLLCVEQPVKPPELPRRRPIGFVIDGERTEA